MRSSWPNKEINFNVIFLPLIWYVFYAPLHEIGHILGCVIVGAEIKDYQLFAHFWEGSFGFAYVDVQGGLDVNMNSLIILISPYILDFISIIIGYYILMRYKIKNSFMIGVAFLIFILRPIYDLVDNYIGYYLNHSDFVLASKIVGKSIIFTFVIMSLLIGITLTLLLLKKYEHFPKVEIEK